MRTGFVLVLKGTHKMYQARWLGGNKFLVNENGKPLAVFIHALIGNIIPYFWDGERYHRLGTSKEEVINNIRNLYLNRTNC